MKKKILIVSCYMILPWLYGGLNQLTSGNIGVLSRDLSHQIYLQTIVPILYGLNLALFLCILLYLFIKILKYVKHYCIVSILGVSIYPISYYVVLLLSYVGSGISVITSTAMKVTPFLYFDRLSLPVLLSVSFMVITTNWCVRKGFFMNYFILLWQSRSFDE